MKDNFRFFLRLNTKTVNSMDNYILV
jgi:hypothetical protein